VLIDVPLSNEQKDKRQYIAVVVACCCVLFVICLAIIVLTIIERSSESTGRLLRQRGEGNDLQDISPWRAEPGQQSSVAERAFAKSNVRQRKLLVQLLPSALRRYR